MEYHMPRLTTRKFINFDIDPELRGKGIVYLTTLPSSNIYLSFCFRITQSDLVYLHDLPRLVHNKSQLLARVAWIDASPQHVRVQFICRIVWFQSA